MHKRHGSGERVNVDAADGARLVAAQRFRAAVTAGLIAVIVFSILWVMLTELFEKVFPWMTILLGYLVGFAVRRAGRGIDWRYPVLAAVLALSGALVANIVVAASVTADELRISTLQLLQQVTTMTWPVFFDEAWNTADTLFAICAAVIAAFYSQRRLDRGQYYALRMWREEGNDD